ncbi:MAG: zinc dependent phospholipase C family protein [Bacillota bacterium]
MPKYMMKGLIRLLIQSHKIIAEHIYENVRDHLNINLDKRFLIYGSIKPDIVPRLFKIPHYHEDSIHFIEDEIYKLASAPFIYDKEYIKHFSIQLGVITHFIADYFCLAHNDKEIYRDNIWAHLKYESTLHGHFKNAKEAPKKLASYISNLGDNKETISALFDHLFSRYKNNIPSFQNDVQHSIESASVISLFIVYNCVENKKLFRTLIEAVA